MMNSQQEALLREIMACGFSAYDLHLYLNTHPYDSKAINYYNQYVKRNNSLVAEYQKKYGPLSPDFEAKVPWKWIESPWPWEMNEGGVKHVGV